MDKSYRELFFSESQEYLKEINKGLVSLERNPQDLEAINSIFRLMHTLKGMAATMGYKEISDFAHHLEDAFDGFRSGKITLTPEIMDTIFENIDAFTILIEDFREGRSPSLDISPHIDKLNQFIPKEEKRKKVTYPEEIKLDFAYLQNLKIQGKEILRIEIHLVEDCPMKGVRAFLVLTRAKDLGEIIRVYPHQELLKEGEFDSSFEIILATSNASDTIKSNLSKILEVEKIDISAFDISSLRKKEKPLPTYIKKIQSMRMPVERLDKIMNLTGELAIAKSRLVQIVQTKDYPSLEESAYLIERLVSALQDEALKMRLLPISYILDNFPRIARDLARKQGKKVDLEITGSKIELDKVLLDEIGDPLVHLIRNAIDHGIELPEERIQRGKSPRGKVYIKVSREKGHIIIEVSDDGKGLDLDKITKKAVKMGLISSEEVSRADSNQILDILATPGFSTSEKVTDVSGRGVGLDVVKTKLDSLGGRLELESQPGQGAKFILTLPLTLAIIKAMLVTIQGEVYAIPLMNIRETVKINKEEITLIKDLEVIRLRDEIIPLIRLDRELGIASSDKEKNILSVVIVEGRAKCMGLVVGKVLGEQDIVVKPLGSFVKKIKGIAGATILGDGRVALILDVVNLR
jgi:two-component system chemotaxis sensor kinase CheA